MGNLIVVRYSYATAGWGELFGIPISSLTDEQIEHISFGKLIELIDLDPRVPPVICKKFKENHIGSFKQFDQIKDILLNSPDVVVEYNRYLARNKHTVDVSFNRKSLVVWDLLDEDNRKQEYHRWVDNKSSILSNNTIDYKWLEKNSPSLCDAVIQQVIKKRGWNTSAFTHMLSSVSASKMKDVLKMLEPLAKHWAAYLLCSPYASKKQIILGLRAIHKRTYLPTIKAPITAEVLKGLPPIMRLDIVEKIVSQYHNAQAITSNVSEEELRTLLFPSIIRYSGRVERVVKNYLVQKGRTK
jgi:hypothetical protein